ncbi:MAG TPA: choice-of-anchor M domain-containing protein [Verrucomicrobiota bacterium]|nr:choice-of-anchor M domain-containing protein [Verrucomicrobiota bacterium]
MKKSPLAILLLPAAALAADPVILSTGHVDIGIGFEAGAFDLHIHQETPVENEFAPDEAILQVNAAAEASIPASLAGALQMPVGSPLWILPKSENPALIFLGLGAEELTPSEWASNITLSLVDVSGPGEFSLWDVGAFGEITVLMSSRPGHPAPDAVQVIPGSHAHYNWGFTAPGDYAVTFTAAGTLAGGGGMVVSEPAAFSFTVVPEPGAATLLLLGAGAWCLARRARPCCHS